MKTVLVANRGEIAIRVIRACRELGLRSVAVFSEADRGSPHSLQADYAVCIGLAPPIESYLRIDRIIDAARATGADAIHPGYGFLAENADFAAAVEEEGLTFVGPTAQSIASMGDKVQARTRMTKAGVRTIPGSPRPVRDLADALGLAREIGFPILLKAVGGGGGRGMRVVENAERLREALEGAAREARGAFGDDRIYVERYLDRPRHIEVQVFGDGLGHVIHLAERECSIQRRHQKMIEEAPSPAVTADLRRAMGEAAVRAAQTLNYRGAGTLEFLLQNDEFFFLEMNTRIQVEHPVTELVAGVDLVRLQLEVAGGKKLPLSQEDVVLRGHSIECRITAEDISRGFVPTSGTVLHLEIPSGPGVRWDGGIAVGSRIDHHYDPLLGKLIVHGQSRIDAVDRMSRALDELVIYGVGTSRPFHRRVMGEPDFRSGEVTTRYLEEHPDLLDPDVESDALAMVAALAAVLEAEWREARPFPRMARVGHDAGASAWQLAVQPWRKQK